MAVPLHRVNEYPMGPHPAGSYESMPLSWKSDMRLETFADVCVILDSLGARLFLL